MSIPPNPSKLPLNQTSILTQHHPTCSIHIAIENFESLIKGENPTPNLQNHLQHILSHPNLQPRCPCHQTLDIGDNTTNWNLREVYEDFLKKGETLLLKHDISCVTRTFIDRMERIVRGEILFGGELEEFVEDLKEFEGRWIESLRQGEGEGEGEGEGFWFTESCTCWIGEGVCRDDKIGLQILYCKSKAAFDDVVAGSMVREVEPNQRPSVVGPGDMEVD